MEFNRVTSYMRASMYEIIFSNETIKMFSFLRLVFIQWGKGGDDTGGKATLPKERIYLCN